jgi:uncharacterized protein
MKKADFKPIELTDKDIFDRFLHQDPPLTSELTFTNLFVWRHCYHPLWARSDDCLLIVLQPEDRQPFGLPPVGPGDKAEALDRLSRVLMEMTADVQICRVGEDFVENQLDRDRYGARLDEDNSDYVYLARDLIDLSGNRFHRKKNHLNRFLKSHEFQYKPLDAALVQDFLDMQESWCQMRECVEDPALLSEDFAIREALKGFGQLDYQGAAIMMGSRVEAFSMGEALNRETAVIHFEKANPDIPGLYAAINNLFCRHAWSEMEYINREQDLGIPGLRKAKQSYNPHHMSNKYILTPRENHEIAKTGKREKTDR